MSKKKKDNVEAFRTIVKDRVEIPPETVLRSALADVPSHVVIVTLVDGEYFVASSHGTPEAVLMLEIGEAQIVNALASSDD